MTRSSLSPSSSVCAFETSPCVRSKRPRVYRHHARMCYHMRAWCRYTRGRFESTHGGVLNVHTEVFLNVHTGTPREEDGSTMLVPRTMVSPRVAQHHPQRSLSSFCWWRNSSGQSSSGRRSKRGHRLVRLSRRSHAGQRSEVSGRRHQSNGVGPGEGPTSAGMRPDGLRAGAMWDNVEDHEGFWQAAREPLTTRAAKHLRWGTRAFSSASFGKGQKSLAGFPSTSRKLLTTHPLASQRYRLRAAC